MYHIWTAQCQIQLRAGKGINQRDFRRFPRPFAAQGISQLAFAVFGSIGSM